MAYSEYILEYREDFKKVKERWLIHDKRSDVYLGFSTRKSALKYAYDLLKKKYPNEAKRGHLGLITLADMEKLLKSIHYSSNQLGWFNHNPVMVTPQGDVLRIYSDGEVKSTSHYLG